MRNASTVAKVAREHYVAFVSRAEKTSKSLPSAFFVAMNIAVTNTRTEIHFILRSLQDVRSIEIPIVKHSCCTLITNDYDLC